MPMYPSVDQGLGIQNQSQPNFPLYGPLDRRQTQQTTSNNGQGSGPQHNNSVTSRGGRSTPELDCSKPTREPDPPAGQITHGVGLEQSNPNIVYLMVMMMVITKIMTLRTTTMMI
jgi:hypothetical protein